MRTFLYPYKVGSKSAKSLEIKRIKHNNSKFKPSRNKVVINWGSSSLPPHILNTCVVINDPYRVGLASNKLNFFKAVKDHVSIPPFTESPAEALSWLRDGSSVVARTILNGNSGSGLVLIDKEEDFIEAPLYTKYIKKKDEYRIHVLGGDVLFVQRKAIPRGTTPSNTRVRNHSNGYIFAAEDVIAPDMVIAEARKAVECLSLDFGAVDAIWNEHYQTAFILEVNTAPGLEGRTLEIYKGYFNYGL